MILFFAILIYDGPCHSCGGIAVCMEEKVGRKAMKSFESLKVMKQSIFIQFADARIECVEHITGGGEAGCDTRGSHFESKIRSRSKRKSRSRSRDGHFAW